MKIIDETTLEMKDVEVTDMTDNELENMFKQALDLNGTTEEFVEKYKAFKKAKTEFDTIYEPFKERLIKLYQDNPDLSNVSKSMIIGDKVKVTYVLPSVRSTIDNKKLKEEEPALAKKFTKITTVNATIRLEEM